VPGPAIGGNRTAKTGPGGFAGPCKRRTRAAGAAQCPARPLWPALPGHTLYQTIRIRSPPARCFRGQHWRSTNPGHGASPRTSHTAGSHGRDRGPAELRLPPTPGRVPPSPRAFASGRFSSRGRPRSRRQGVGLHLQRPLRREASVRLQAGLSRAATASFMASSAANCSPSLSDGRRRLKSCRQTTSFSASKRALR